MLPCHADVASVYDDNWNVSYWLSSQQESCNEEGMASFDKNVEWRKGKALFFVVGTMS